MSYFSIVIGTRVILVPFPYSLCVWCGGGETLVVWYRLHVTTGWTTHSGPFVIIKYNILE